MWGVHKAKPLEADSTETIKKKPCMREKNFAGARVNSIEVCFDAMGDPGSRRVHMYQSPPPKAEVPEEACNLESRRPIPAARCHR